MKQYSYLNPYYLRNDLRDEAYEYFDKHISQLPKRPDETIDTANSIFADSDVDAFRHAYVSGVFTQEFGEVQVFEPNKPEGFEYGPLK